MTTTNNAIETKTFTTDATMILCANTLNIDTEKGINYSAMNDISNFLPYCYLLLTDESAKLTADISKLEERIKKLPSDKKATADQKLEKAILKRDKSVAEARKEEISPVLEELKQDKLPITPLAALWAYAKGTKEFANGENCPNQAKMLESVAKFHKYLQGHLEEMKAFADNAENRKGKVYKDMKSELSAMFSLIFGTPITANATDVVFMAQACVIAKAGVDSKSNGKKATLSIVRKDTILRKSCELLASKLQERENGNSERTDGKDAEIEFTYQPEKSAKDSEPETTGENCTVENAERTAQEVADAKVHQNRPELNLV